MKHSFHSIKPSATESGTEPALNEMETLKFALAKSLLTQRVLKTAEILRLTPEKKPPESLEFLEQTLPE